MMNDDKTPYGMTFEFTYVACSRCGAVHVPDGEYTEDCPACQVAKNVNKLWQTDKTE